MVQEVSTQSWGGRLGSAFFGILIGIALIIGSFFLIFWNEGHGLHTAQSLQQTRQVLITVPDSPIDQKNNLRVVYLTGLATTTETLKDSLLNLSENAIKLKRHVEMYQWKESSDTTTEKEWGGSEKTVKTYSYQQVWSPTLIDSTQFKDQTAHQNPAKMLVAGRDQVAEEVTIGDFHLPSDLIAAITGATAIDLKDVDVSALQNKLNKPVKHNDSDLYVGADPDYPKIGDMKISASFVQPQKVSVIAQQKDESLQPYAAPAGENISLLAMGQQSPEKMLSDAESENSIMTWVLRGISLVMMVIGVGLLLQPLTVIADVIPFVGTLIGLGTWFVAIVCGLFLWGVGTAIAWFTARPIWALGLMIIIVGICYFMYKRKKQVKTA